MDKKGVSALIATVLIIGITISAFGIVYFFVIPFVSEGIQAQKACSDVQMYINTMQGYTCYDSSTQTVNVQVKRGPNEVDMSGIQIIVSGKGNTGTLNIIENSSEASRYDPNIIGYWSFDNVSGTTVYDSSGNNDGTIIGGATVTSGRIGNALNFDGVNDYMSVPDSDSWLWSNNNWAIHFWINTIQSEDYVLMGRSSEIGNEADWDLGFRRGGTSIHAVLSNGTGIVGADTDIINNGIWHHVAFVRDGANVISFTDGELSTTWNIGSSFTIQSREGYPLEFGRYPSYIPSSAHFNGAIDEFAIWNKALSQTEVQDIYNNGIQEIDIQNQDGVIMPNAQKVYSVLLSSVGLTSADSVSVAPILRIGKKNHVCNAVPEVTISGC